jgi:hypothetical protein
MPTSSRTCGTARACSAATLHAWITVAEPYREFAGRFFAVAAQPGNPLSPFSPGSAPARAADASIFGLPRLPEIRFPAER